ncbi:MAG: c-type cytochrome [Gammaproteobacteria bacterium]
MLKQVKYNVLFFCVGLALLAPHSSYANGSSIYQDHCAMCHETGVSGAPKRGDSAAWSGRGDLQTLLNAAKNGMGAMPSHGNCPSCSDSDLTAAINYMK